jgi:O-antigen ligase
MVNQLAGTDLQRISLSESGILSMYRSFFLLSLLFYYICLKELITHNQKVFFMLFVCIIALGMFEALYGLVQFVKPQMGILWLQIKGRAAHGSIIYKNQYASLLNMIWPLAFAGGISYFLAPFDIRRNQGARRRMKDTIYQLSATRIRAILLIFASVIMVLSVLFSLSRGGILSMVAVIFLLAVLMPFSKLKKTIFFVFFVILIAGYGAILGLDTIITRFDSIGSSGGTRLDLYMLSLPIIADHWLTGIGLGSYTLLSPIYLKGFPFNLHYQRVHCEYIELFIELGIPMATLLFVWMISGVYKLSKQLYNGHLSAIADRRKIVLGIAALCSLLGFLTHGFVDFGWRLPANALYAVTLVAFITASCQPDRSNSDKHSS